MVVPSDDPLPPGAVRWNRRCSRCPTADLATGRYGFRMPRFADRPLWVEPFDRDIEVSSERDLHDLVQSHFADRPPGVLFVLAGGWRDCLPAAVLDRVESGLIPLQRITDERVLLTACRSLSARTRRWRRTRGPARTTTTIGRKFCIRS